MFKPVILVPVYNHAAQFAGFLPDLLRHGIPVIVADDGSPAGDARLLASLAARHGLTLIRSEVNRGKGHAFLSGFEKAAALGFSHVLQIDADGQHCAADIPRFLAAAREAPGALVCGVPEFDASAPRARVHGRKVTTFWVALETASRAIPDALCGFRVYPVAPMRRLVKRICFRRMAFDPEIIVRASWERIAVKPVATRVVYPAGGHSNYRALRDTLAISLMHACLCTLAPLMLLRKAFLR